MVMTVDIMPVIYEDGSPVAVIHEAFNIIATDEVNAESFIDFDMFFTDKKRKYIKNQSEVRLGDGIYKIQGSKVSRLGHEDGLTSEVVMRIKWDEERQMFWLVTSNSIEYMKDGAITAVSNFPYSNNYDIYFDANGEAWVLSSNGIYITSVEELLANESIEYSFYNTRSGLPYITTGNSRSYLDDSGHLYISGTTGVCMVNIEASENDAGNVRLAVPNVEVDDHEVPVKVGEPVELPAGSKRLVINAYAITYGLNNPRITYYLDGFDKEPIATTKQDLGSIIYTNLDGGKYVFHINAINDETGKVEKTMAVSINKENSAYENFWFWVILMGVIISFIAYAIWGYFNKRNEALLEKQEEDRLFISEIMHTFAKCIDMRDSQNRGHSFRVAYYTKMLAEKLRESRGYTDEQIEEFHNIALLHDIGKLSIPDKILNKPSRLDDDEFVKEPCNKVVIFMSVFNVHVNRSPIRGKIKLQKYFCGRFRPAYKDTVGFENEHHVLGIENERIRISVKQIAGILARRIVSYVTLDDEMKQGELYGMIKFGSCLEVVMPKNVEIAVTKGQKVSGGLTVLGRIKD